MDANNGPPRSNVLQIEGRDALLALLMERPFVFWYSAPGRHDICLAVLSVAVVNHNAQLEP
jgi:hypothetical protein